MTIPMDTVFVHNSFEFMYWQYHKINKLNEKKAKIFQVETKTCWASEKKNYPWPQMW